MSGAPSPRIFLSAWRMLRRDLASGELFILLIALVLSVCAMTSVSFIVERAGKGFAAQANQLLGADVVLRSDTEIKPDQAKLANIAGLQSAQTVSLLSMIQSKDNLRLSELKAISAHFPLRGKIELVNAPENLAAQGFAPKPGHAWLTRAGATQLDVKVGERLRVGQLQLQVDALIAAEPDVSLDYFTSQPRLIFNLEDLPRTGLIQEGSRASYRLLVTGSAAATQVFSAAAKASLRRGQSLESVQDARPQLRAGLARGEQFLSLAALVSVMLAAVAVAMAAKRHAARHLDGCALMRCLGASQSTITQIYLTQLALLGLIASAFGIVLALALQAVVCDLLARRLGITLPSASVRPAFEGMAVAFAVLASFAAPPVLALRAVPALRVLRRDLPSTELSGLVLAVFGLAGIAALMLWKAQSIKLAGIVLAGILLTLGVLALAALALFALVKLLRKRLRGAWRYGLANAGRRQGASVVQVCALGLGLMMILLLGFVRTELISAWQKQLPANTPNRFLIGVQPDQTEPLAAALQAAGVRKPDLFPMIRARFIARNGVAITEQSFAATDVRAARLAEREFNLSAADSVQADNQITAGTFWQPGETSAQISVEQELAQTLGWKLGDLVRFDIAGEIWEVRISSLRQVQWESMRPNFFVIAPLATVKALPASYITSFYLPAEHTGKLERGIIGQFPNLSLIDLDAILGQLKRTADQVAAAVQYIFYFTLLAGLLVLLAAISASQDERLQEGALMRALGASSRQLRLAQLSEFAVLGGISGLIAAIAANALTALLAKQVFDFVWQPNWRMSLLCAVGAALLVVLSGLIATRRILKVPPGLVLREL
jgi:putative ABC transport system permease protein